jgi:multidrug resistance efflux pump
MKRQSVKWAPVAMVLVAVALSGCNLHGRPTVERKARPLAQVPVATATETPEPDRIVSPGVIEPWGAQVDLSAQESGWIAEIVVKEGDLVRKGELLATLDDAPQRHGIELAKADVAEAAATLAKVERGVTPEELRQAQADYEAAAAKGVFARAAATRSAQLHADRAISDEEAERAAAEAQAQSALAERALARLGELKRGARIEDLAAARARLEAARARLCVAEDNLARRRIVAPQSGTVLLSRYHAGEFYDVGAGSLFVLGDLTRLQVRLEVDEIDAFGIQPGAPCTLYSDAGVRLAEGTVVRLAPKMGRRALPLESPTARADVRVREVFVEIPATSKLIPNQRVWGHASRVTRYARKSSEG